MSFTSISFIQGLSFGFEFVDEIPKDNIPDSWVIDILCFRLIFSAS